MEFVNSVLLLVMYSLSFLLMWGLNLYHWYERGRYSVVRSILCVVYGLAVAGVLVYIGITFN